MRNARGGCATDRHNSVARLLGLLAVVIGLVTAISPARVHAVYTPASVMCTACDGQHDSTLLTHTVAARGPSAQSYNVGAARDAGDPCSSDASTDPADLASIAAYTYDDFARFIQSDSTTSHVAAFSSHGQDGGLTGNAAALMRSGVAAKTESGAASAINGVRLRAQLTGEQIAGGHAFDEHVLKAGEFPGITTRQQFATRIEEVVTNGESRELLRGRTAYWEGNTVVIRDPSSLDGGTAFVPTGGYNYFLGLK